MSALTLYNYWRSSSSWRVRIGLHLKSIPFTYVGVNLAAADGGEQYKAEHQARNPMSQVPVLEWHENGVTRRLPQSLVILEWLDEKYPAVKLLPTDSWLRAQARVLAEHCNSGIQPLHNLAVIKRVDSIQAGQGKLWSAHWLERGLTALEQAVQPNAGRFCVGDSPTVADCCLVPQLYAARRFGADVSKFSTLLRIEQTCAELPAFQAAHADAQPDAVSTPNLPPEKR